MKASRAAGARVLSRAPEVQGLQVVGLWGSEGEGFRIELLESKDIGCEGLAPKFWMEGFGVGGFGLSVIRCGCSRVGRE